MAEPNPIVECIRCNVEMELGEMSGNPEFYLDEEDAITRFPRTTRRVQYKVYTYRCPRCGLLEFIAH